MNERFTDLHHTSRKSVYALLSVMHISNPCTNITLCLDTCLFYDISVLSAKAEHA